MPRVMQALTRLCVSPQRVICSTALRARETLGLALQRWNADMRVDMLRSVYEAEAEDLLEIAAAAIADSAPACLAIIGHNPAMEDLAMLVSGPSSNAQALARLEQKFPTGAVAVLSGGRDDFAPGRMTLEHFLVPRELPEV